MTLNGEALEDFKRRYENVFAVRLSDVEARALEADLKHLYRLVRRRAAPKGLKPEPIRPPWLSSPEVGRWGPGQEGEDDPGGRF